jgi:methylglutamate dehydrogenase subunit C
MRIECCYCGPRGNEEFAYLGDATPVRPDADPSRPLDEAARQRWHDYVYLRDNPAGPHRELWQHVSGCRAWLVVTRDTRTHEVLKVEAACVPSPLVGEGQGGGDRRTSAGGIPPTPNPSPQGGGEFARRQGHGVPSPVVPEARLRHDVGEGQGGEEPPTAAVGTPPTPSPSPRGGGEFSWRLGEGGLIDRSRSLSFSFDGRTYRGHPGDTLASALLASGVHLVGRSFKYHRPRGILTAGPEEPNALVELRAGARREPNTRATTAELYDGLIAASQNRWPSLRVDLLAVNSLIAPLLSAGFYYKTFMWPASFWEKVYEPLIRRAAGLGRASGETDPDTYEKAFLHCDVLIVGGGPAGLMAALAAGRTGARVLVCEEDFHMGGRLIAEHRAVADRSGADWVAHIEAELAALPEVRVMRRTTVVGVYDGGTYSALERVNDHLAEPPAHEPRQRLWRIFARRCVLAAGAIERPLAFGNNDRPGIMLAGAVRTYLNRYAVAPGRRAVVFGTSDETARTVADLSRAGVEVAAVVDPRPSLSGSIQAAAKSAGARLIAGGTVTRARGSLRVRAVDIRTASGETLRVGCDLVCVSGGWSPTLHLTSHLGSRPVWNEAIAAFVPGLLPNGMSVAGAAGGQLDLADALRAGAGCGLEAASDCGFSGQPVDLPEVEPESVAQTPLWRVRGTRGKAFVDFQNDVSDEDVALAGHEGFRAVEQLKRYTTLGMATDQGKTSNLAGLALMAEFTAKSIPHTGTTTFRPPFAPVAIGALAGLHRGKAFRPVRLPPSHRWAQEQGAVFVESGAWLRAQWYPRAGETDWLESVSREVGTVRGSVGVCDVSTLGKIDLQGRDAAVFLDRLYANSWSTLGVGKARYGLMLREDGFVLDDGTTSRLAADRYVVTTTTASAAKVLQHMEFCHQWLWPELDVQFSSVSEQWAQFSVAGPRSRDVLRRIVDPQHDISNAALPYMAAAGDLTAMGGVPVRLFRISFSGELAYEIAVPAGYGDAMIRRIMEVGQDFGIAPYGTEALGVMRIEKGHVAGNEINGQTTARDLGLGRMLSARKDHIGRVMAQRPALLAADRPTLVGFKPVDRAERLRAGAHFIPEGAQAVAANDQGYMTSVAFSPSLGHWIGLGLLAHGASRHGQRVRACDPLRSANVLVEVCDPVFYDSAGERLRG